MLVNIVSFVLVLCFRVLLLYKLCFCIMIVVLHDDCMLYSHSLTVLPFSLDAAVIVF